ncbi:MAG: hypothetical protein IAE67_02285 [Candidatus Competibacteraceae bacterium]|nr:hypothetical protein [Candidatus Competibacteraceae bacterium]
MSKGKTYFIFIATLILIFLAIQTIRPEPKNWKPSFSKIHKWPYGNYALFRLLENIFPKQHIIYSRTSPYTFLPEYENGFNYILITNKYTAGDEENDALFNFVSRGNNLFIATSEINYILYQQTGLSIESDYSHPDSLLTSTINFTETSLKKNEGYKFRGSHVSNYFSIDSLMSSYEILILGKNAKNQPNFVCMKIEEGLLFMHANPLVFTNYNIVYDPLNQEYVSKALSYLPIQSVIWDDYYNLGPEGSTSEVRYLLSSPYLKTAWFILLFSILTYMLTESKRRQRIIPVIKPPINTTLEFTHTVGRLYFQQKDHANLARKKVTYFLESIRRRFNIDTQQINEEFAEQLSARSGVDKDTVQSVTKHIQRIQSGIAASEKELLALSHSIDMFNIKSNA